MMDRVPISDDNQGQRDFRNRLRSLRTRWLSSDPIQFGDLNLPLRPLLAVMGVALGVVGISAALKQEPDAAKQNLVATAAVDVHADPISMGRYRSGSDRLVGYREAGPAPAVYQGFRFREEDVARGRMSAHWAEPEGYRFRPLTDQERGRMHEAAAQRSFIPDVGGRSLYDELSRTYEAGFDRGSSPARPDYSRTW